MSKKKNQEKSGNAAETAATGGQKAERKRRGPSKKAGAKKAVRSGKTAAAARQANDIGRENKSTKILELIARPQGATLPELMDATCWQAHSVRGFLSTAAKKRRFKIESTRNESGQRTYRVPA